MLLLRNIPFLEAARYGGDIGTVTTIVIHDMEMAETGTTAESCAKMFNKTSRDASAHYCVDNNSAVQCVPLSCKAYHAPPNAGKIGIEHAGYAKQGERDWLDAYGLAMLDTSAQISAQLAVEFAIPVVKLSVADLLAGRRGFCGHIDVSNAWHQTDHGDPGPNFPWSYYLMLVNKYVDEIYSTVEDDVATDPGVIASEVWNRFTITAPGGKEVKLVEALELILAQQPMISSLKTSVDSLAATVAKLAPGITVVSQPPTTPTQPYVPPTR